MANSLNLKMDSDFIHLLLLSFSPLLITAASIAAWKVFYVGQRPLSYRVKLIVIGLIVWASLPTVLILLILLLAATG